MKWILYAIANALVVVVCALGTVGEVQGAWNVFAFYVWGISVPVLTLSSFMKASQETLAKDKTPRAKEIWSNCCTWACIALCVWVGNVFTALACLWSLLMLGVLRAKVRELQKGAATC